MPYSELVSTLDKLPSDFANEDISVDFPPLNPVAASDIFLKQIAKFDSLSVSIL